MKFVILERDCLQKKKQVKISRSSNSIIILLKLSTNDFLSDPLQISLLILSEFE